METRKPTTAGGGGDGAGERPCCQKASEQDSLLHQGVLKGSSRAREEIASIHWRNLQKIFRARYRHCDPDIVGGAVTDVLMEYLESPSEYDPTKGTLGGYLAWKAKQKINNRFRSEKRRAVREENAALVFYAKGLLGAPVSPREAVIDAENRRTLLSLLNDRRDRLFLKLLLQNEHRVTRLARVLGCRGHPPDEQKREIKKNRDRIVRKLQRRLG